MSILSASILKNTTRIMVLGGLVAFFLVAINACQPARNGSLDAYKKGSLKRLTVLDAPPPRPALTFKTEDGRALSLSELEGKLVLLNVWASWCAPCIAEMPSLNTLSARESSDDFAVVTVSLDRTAEEAAGFFEDHDIDALTPWHDDSFSLGSKLAVPGLPVSVFYDPRGSEIARVPGEADWAGGEALALIDYLRQLP